MTPRADGNLLEPARQTGEIGLRPRRRDADRELAALHRGFRPAETAAGEHRIGQVRRRPEAGDADIEALRPHRRDRHQRHAHRQIEIVPDPARGRRQRLAGARKIIRGDREACTVAAEHERKLASLQRIADGRDHRRAGHVDRLVARLRDRPGRFHDIGDADAPVVRQRRIQRRVHQAGKAAKDRNAAVEAVAAVWFAHGRGTIRIFATVRQIRLDLGFGFKGCDPGCRSFTCGSLPDPRRCGFCPAFRRLVAARRARGLIAGPGLHAKAIDKDIEQPHDAFLPARLVVQIAHADQRAQNVFGADVGADLAGGDRAVQQARRRPWSGGRTKRR